MTLPLDIETPASALDAGQTGVAGNETKTANVGEAVAQTSVTPPTPVLQFVVHGQPAPQGSKRHIGNGVMIESSKKVKPWREAVKHAALDAIAKREGTSRPFTVLAGPVWVTLVFTVARPKSHYRTGRNSHLLRDNAPLWPSTKPDGDKLDRACLDALTDAGVFADDAQVAVRVSIKTYPDVHPRAIATPGAFIAVRPLPATRTDST